MGIPLREAPPSLLLGRPERRGNLAEAAAWVGGRRVLVTGAAGSVGSHLAPVLLAAQPAWLVLLDHHEYSLFNLEREVGAARAGLSYELLDLASERRLHRLFERTRPEVVIHLAAAKHVPYGERFCDNVIETNVFATERLLDLADAAGTDIFVYPSSDKSVAPPSLYGASKRISEALVQLRARGRRWTLCRYVNILGTRGSVIETFTNQVAAGDDLTITDKRMTRYWISMEEALWLALQAGAMGASAQVLMPDCGEPVAVVETAQRIAAALCPERCPYPVTFTGIRPGERLHELLLSDNERFVAGPAEGVHAVGTRRDPATLLVVPNVLGALRAYVDEGDQRSILSLAMEAATALQ